jgi:hypothetical protein
MRCLACGSGRDIAGPDASLCDADGGFALEECALQACSAGAGRRLLGTQPAERVQRVAADRLALYIFELGCGVVIDGKLSG